MVVKNYGKTASSNFFRSAKKNPDGFSYLAVVSWWHDTSQGSLVEDQHGRASLKTRVSSLTLPVTVARLAQRNVAVGIFVTES